jgi:hypothetical protein
MVRELDDFFIILLADFFVDPMEAGHANRVEAHGIKAIDIIRDFIEIARIRTSSD